MTHPRFVLDVLPEPLAICRLAPDAPLPAWAIAGAFFTVSRTTDELSVVCAAARVPAGIQASRGWRALRLRGPFAMNAVGVLLSVIEPLAAAGVSVMPIATYETDYVLVPEDLLAQATEALGRAGHTVSAAGRETA